MNGAQHTSGPWKIAHPGSRRVDVVGPSKTIVAECGAQGHATHEANARLIASAPELLQVARLVLDTYDTMTLAEVAEVFGPADTEFVKLARAAVAKAEGRSDA